jgi:DNA-binding PadR family transcriptional regulator
MFHRPFWGARDRRGETALGVVILKLLEEQMSTSIELVRRLEERYGGRLAFDASEVYPMLQYLEDRGFVTQEPIGDRKAYAVTEAGFAYMAEQGRQEREAEAAGEAWTGRGGSHHHGHHHHHHGHHHWHHHDHHGHHHHFHELHHLAHDIKQLARLFKHEMRAGRMNPERMARLRAIVDRARRDIEACLRGAPEHDLA